MIDSDREKLLHELMEIRSAIFDIERMLKRLENRTAQISERIADKQNQVLSSNACLSSSFMINSGNRDISSKKLLIGELPTVLLSTKFFPDNERLIGFAKKSLKLPISVARKRSRREIIGIIITEVEKLDLKEITAFRNILDIVLKEEPKTTNDFFDFWDKTIRSMPIG
jgi:hypothetical protein